MMQSTISFWDLCEFNLMLTLTALDFMKDFMLSYLHHIYLTALLTRRTAGFTNKTHDQLIRYDALLWNKYIRDFLIFMF